MSLVQTSSYGTPLYAMKADAAYEGLTSVVEEALDDGEVNAMLYLKRKYDVNVFVQSFLSDTEMAEGVYTVSIDDLFKGLN